MTNSSHPSKWPKVFPPLTEEQKRISDDFMKHWHDVLPKRFSIVDRFNHQFPVRNSPSHFRTTLEIGAGNGEHLQYEKLSSEQRKNYHALELRANMSQQIQERFPEVQITTGDCQERLPYEEGFFDRILAVHVLEHLPNLPAAIAELYRVCNKTQGVLLAVIPCEGSPLYSLARKISAQRIFEKRYKQSYRWFIEREHVNRPREIVEELERSFRIVKKSFFPIPIPALWCNLCLGLKLVPK